MSALELEPVRISRLKKFSLSAAHFHADEPEEGSEEADEDQTASMELGTMLHQHVLQGVPVAVSPCRRDPRMKQYQEFLTENMGRLIVNKSQARHIRGMAESLKRDPIAFPLLHGIIEQTMIWSWMGRPCRGTPDVRTPFYLTELKTTRCAEPRWFQREADKRGYHTQLAWYDAGCSLLGDPAYRELWIVAVESKPPYAVTCHRVLEERRQQAARQMRLWFEQLLQCEAANHWPAYTEVALDWGLDEQRPWERNTAPSEIDAEALA